MNIISVFNQYNINCNAFKELFFIILLCFYSNSISMEIETIFEATGEYEIEEDNLKELFEKIIKNTLSEKTCSEILKLEKENLPSEQKILLTILRYTLNQNQQSNHDIPLNQDEFLLLLDQVLQINTKIENEGVREQKMTENFKFLKFSYIQKSIMQNEFRYYDFFINYFKDPDFFNTLNNSIDKHLDTKDIDYSQLKTLFAKGYQEYLKRIIISEDFKSKMQDKELMLKILSPENIQLYKETISLSYVANQNSTINHIKEIAPFLLYYLIEMPHHQSAKSYLDIFTNYLAPADNCIEKKIINKEKISQEELALLVLSYIEKIQPTPSELINFLLYIGKHTDLAINWDMEKKSLKTEIDTLEKRVLNQALKNENLKNYLQNNKEDILELFETVSFNTEEQRFKIELYPMYDEGDIPNEFIVEFQAQENLLTRAQREIETIASEYQKQLDDQERFHKNYMDRQESDYQKWKSDYCKEKNKTLDAINQAGIIEGIQNTVNFIKEKLTQDQQAIVLRDKLIDTILHGSIDCSKKIEENKEIEIDPTAIINIDDTKQIELLDESPIEKLKKEYLEKCENSEQKNYDAIIIKLKTAIEEKFNEVYTAKENTNKSMNSN